MGQSGLSDEFVECLNSHQLSVDPAQVWVFGYGSLCWRPNFPYTEKRIGQVEGYSRRFWQGSVTHRGTQEQPGRVATLVENKRGTTWGCAFRIEDPAAVNYLHRREVSLGGYQTRVARFQPRDCRQAGFPVILYLATAENPHWLGPAPIVKLASQVAAATGWKGPNADYVLQLHHFMVRHIPEDQDRHLAELAALVNSASTPVTDPPDSEQQRRPVLSDEEPSSNEAPPLSRAEQKRGSEEWVHRYGQEPEATTQESDPLSRGR